MRIKILILTVTLLIVSACNNEMFIVKKIKIFSSDKSQCITILTGTKFRYIIPGNHDRVPEDNYIKLNVKDAGVDGDIFYGCWNKNGYEWELYGFSGIIVENKLNKTKYKFEQTFPKDAISNVKKGVCFDFDYIKPEVNDHLKDIVSLEVN